jgi:TetR/AcrR family transcriptional regulator
MSVATMSANRKPVRAGRIPDKSAGQANERSTRRNVRTPIRRNPVLTRAKLLKAASAEFAEHGLQGARINRIGLRAGVDKRLVYHYFASKEALYTAVLEQTYARLRESDESMNLGDLDPEATLVALVTRMFERAFEARDLPALIADENVHKGRHIRRSPKIRSLHKRLVSQIETMLRAGQQKGVFRRDIDAVRLFVSIVGLSTIYLTNAHSLAAIFGRSLSDPKEKALWRQHIVDFVVRAVRP